jgi:hypothetical protein
MPKNADQISSPPGAGAAWMLCAERPRGPTPEETTLPKRVARRLVLDLPGGARWIDPREGTATPAALGEGQLRRRLIDHASFDVRLT